MKKNSSSSARKTLNTNQRALLSAALRPAPKKLNPSELQFVYAFDDDFPRMHTALFADKENRLWLTDGNEDCIQVQDAHIPIKDALPEMFHEVTLIEALEWYARCVPFSTGGSGTVALLCEMASEQLKGVA